MEPTGDGLAGMAVKLATSISATGGAPCSDAWLWKTTASAGSTSAIIVCHRNVESPSCCKAVVASDGTTSITGSRLLLPRAMVAFAVEVLAFIALTPRTISCPANEPCEGTGSQHGKDSPGLSGIRARPRSKLHLSNGNGRPEQQQRREHLLDAHDAQPRRASSPHAFGLDNGQGARAAMLVRARRVLRQRFS